MITKLKTMPLLWILPLYVLWHLAQLFFFRPEFLMTSPEELYRGTIAYELLTGPKSGLMSYLPDSYAGGSVVVALMGVFFFILLGPTLFALKLVPLVIFTLTLLFWFLAISRHCGKKSGIIFALLYTFAPFQFMFFSHSHRGDHPETVLFTGIVIFLLFEILYPLRHQKSRLFYVEKINRESGIHTPPPGVEGNASWWLFFLLGITCGFGIWFAYIFAITVLSAFVLSLFHGPGYLFTKKFGFFILGFLIGFSPWLITNFLSGFSGLNIHHTSVVSHFNVQQIISAIVHPRQTVLYKFLTSFAAPNTLQPSVPWKLMNYGYLLSYLLPICAYALACFTKKIKRPPYAVLFFVIYIVLFLLLSELSKFRGTRFIIPLFPILFAITGIAFQGLITGLPKLSKILYILTGALVMVGLLSGISTFSLQHRGQVLRSAGYSYYYLANSHEYPTSAFCFDPATCAKTYNKFKSELTDIDRHAYAIALGVRLQGDMETGDVENSVNKYYKAIDPELHPYFLYYTGFVAYDRSLDWEQSEAKVIALKPVVGGNSFWMYRGMLDAKAWVTQKEFSLKNTESFLKKFPPHLNLFVWQAAGQEHMNLLLSQKIDWAMIDIQINKALVIVPIKYRGPFLKGVGASIMLNRLLEKTPGSLSLIQALPKAWHPNLLWGTASILESAEVVDSFPILRDGVSAELNSHQKDALQKARERFRHEFQNKT